nr:hypothetical protein F0323_18870 [Enterobacter hormaechei]
MVRNQTTFIPQSLHRGGLVMTTGGHPPPISAEVLFNVRRRGLKRGDDYDSYRIDQKENGN